MSVTVVVEETQQIIFRADTVKEAEAFIAGIEYKAADEVHSGAYGINAPEHLINP